MKELTLEWISKAEGDYASAKREYRARKSPNYDSGESADKQLAADALRRCERLRTIIRHSLGFQ